MFIIYSYLILIIGFFCANVNGLLFAFDFFRLCILFALKYRLLKNDYMKRVAVFKGGKNFFIRFTHGPIW